MCLEKKDENWVLKHDRKWRPTVSHDYSHAREPKSLFRLFLKPSKQNFKHHEIFFFKLNHELKLLKGTMFHSIVRVNLLTQKYDKYITNI